jgi:hypothetical protein
MAQKLTLTKMKNFTATQKGLITGIAMIATSFIIYAAKRGFDNKLQYITYTLYLAGVVWTLFDYSKQAAGEAKFGSYFSTGFKCFIVVTLLMVLFTVVFLIMHPEMKEQMAVTVREQLIKQGNKTPKEIEESIAMAKKSFMPALVMATVFSYLVIGAMVTAVAGAVLMQRKKNVE